MRDSDRLGGIYEETGLFEGKSIEWDKYLEGINRWTLRWENTPNGRKNTATNEPGNK